MPRWFGPYATCIVLAAVTTITLVACKGDVHGSCNPAKESQKTIVVANEHRTITWVCEKRLNGWEWVEQ